MPHRKLATPPIVTRSRLAIARDQALLSVLRRQVDRGLIGRLGIRLPSGRGIVIGSGHTYTGIAFHSFSAIGKCIRRGTLGFAEAYLDGDITVTDLGAVFRFFIDNRSKLERAGSGIFSVRGADRAVHKSRRNTRVGSRRNISEHYDLGNAFYALWLDPSMSYSSALFMEPDLSLESAQAAKNEAVSDAIDLKPGDSVLEIGGGWGGFAETAAIAGANVRAITISDEQLQYARNRLDQLNARAGGDVAQQQGRAEVAFEDYRDTTGTYDAIVSIEMIEAVGEENWEAYFKTIHDRLKPGGRVAIQAITIREASFENYRSKPDFIQRYIFPGGMLPTRTLMRTLAEDAGLETTGQLRFGASYAETLRRWRETFHAEWPHIEALGFDNRFRLLWDYYLSYCEAGFERGVIDVGIYGYRRPTVA